MRFAFFNDSETIALARLQMVVGLVAAVLTDVLSAGLSTASRNGSRSRKTPRTTPTASAPTWRSRGLSGHHETF
ncbi:hypothetical protein MES5069_70387 [Mesorhizobium escarrei]|uniref:Uncharacterized protein n=1 Tax=Mesorhizobium escarrei TaxID=666018 RepID=A0ABM9EHF0_9HYPH|nr:hypothetical protein MES5069_70387 [Mesorhizobium escarrei]